MLNLLEIRLLTFSGPESILWRKLMSDLTFFCIFAGTVAITVLWWWVQRPLLARRWVYVVTLGTIVAAGMAAYFLPPVWPEMRVAALLLAMCMINAFWWMLATEGANEPRCRRLARLAILPAREVSVACVPCDLSAEVLARNISERLQEPESVNGGGLVAEYEDDYRNWDLALYPTPGESWLLLMWTYDDFELRDREVAAICARYGIPFTSELKGRMANALCVSRDGRLDIYPAPAREDVEIVLKQICC